MFFAALFFFLQQYKGNFEENGYDDTSFICGMTEKVCGQPYFIKGFDPPFLKYPHPFYQCSLFKTFYLSCFCTFFREQKIDKLKLMQKNAAQLSYYATDLKLTVMCSTPKISSTLLPNFYDNLFVHIYSCLFRESLTRSS